MKDNSWIGRQSTVKQASYQKQSVQIKCNPNQNFNSILHRHRKHNPKFYMKAQRPRRAKAILNKKKVDDITNLILDYTTEPSQEKQHGTGAKKETDQ